MAEKSETENKIEDKELSELLNSALKDFGDSDDKNQKSDTSSSPSSSKKKENENMDEEWNQELVKQLTDCYNSDMMKMFNSGGPPMSKNDISEAIKQITASGQVFLNQDGGEIYPDFEQTISQAVQELTQGLDQSKLNDMMAGGDSSEFFSAFNQNMMQCLLSKEVLHPALKDISDQFPDWLRDNKEKISAEDYEKYSTQQKLICEVCSILDKEQDSDSLEVKNKRYEEVLELMIKLQDYGQPPVELVGEVNQVDPKNCAMM